MARVFLISSHYMGVLFMEELLKTGDEILGVAAWPDSAGWYVPEEYDVRTHAFRHYLPLYEPDPKKLNSPEFLEVIGTLKPDFVVSGYYPQIFRKKLLSIPPGGCVNIHPTGLPRFRGLSPYFTHMLHGDEKNYITMHWLDPGVDTGDIIAQASVDILPDDTGFTCGHRLTEAGGAMFAEYWPLIKEGSAPRRRQDESKASVFNFDWSMAQIDWSRTSRDVFNLVRSIAPPLSGAWTPVGGYRMKVGGARIVSKDDLLPEGAIPGEVLALTGTGMFVQCGEGQVELRDTSLEGATEKTPFDVLAPGLGGTPPVVLG
jgi:methionyl-tRNA formyltransferase